VIASRSDARRIAGAIVAAGAVLACASCAAGQNAATAEEVPSIDGTNATVGDMQLEGVAIQAPSGSSYAAGSSAPLALAIVNNGDSADTLTAVTSPAFSGWGIAKTAAAAAQPTPTSIPAGSSLRLGLHNLGASSSSSTETLVLSALAKGSSPLFPGGSVSITFRFAKAGSTTLTVPVQLSTTPNDASVSAPSQPGEGYNTP
jgi:copper(I)-binding protein